MLRLQGLQVLRIGLVLAAVEACARPAGQPFSAIPQESEWIECCVVLEAGARGSWDAQLAGASTPSSVVKREGVYFLYYGGADGQRSTDGGPRHRAIGVATSRDGIRFRKYEGNPVMTNLPTDGEEEGANSAAVVLDGSGRFLMYFGAAMQIDAMNINADGVLAISDDGLRFTRSAKVLDHRDESLYGSGDEIFPLAAYSENDRWFVFYSTNGGPTSRDLAVAWGASEHDLRESRLVVDGSDRNPAHVGATINRLPSGEIAVFVQRGWWPRTRIEARTAKADQPHELRRPVAIYDGPMWARETKFVSVFLDRAKKTWFLYRSNWEDQILLHLAPAGPRDVTPPTAPPSLELSTTGGSEFRLSWLQARDDDTGVAFYRVYRDGERIGTAIDMSFEISERSKHPPRAFEVSAVNFHGIEGPSSEIEASLP